MKLLTHVFLLVFGFTSLSILFVNSEIASYIPVFWMIYGFAFHFGYYVFLHSKLSTKLIADIGLMKEVKLEVNSNGKEVFMSSLFENFKEVKLKKPETSHLLDIYKRTLKLSVIGFLLSIIQILLVLNK